MQLKALKPDVVHTRNWGGLDGIIAARLAGIRGDRAPGSHQGPPYPVPGICTGCPEHARYPADGDRGRAGTAETGGQGR